MKTKNDFPGWLTELQWLQKGYVVKRGHYGQELWTNCCHKHSAYYYSPKDVRKDEAKADAIMKERNKETRIRRERKQKAMEAELQKREVWNTEYQWLQQGREPNADARWKLGEELNHYFLQFGSRACYCHISDTHLIEDKK